MFKRIPFWVSNIEDAGESGGGQGESTAEHYQSFGNDNSESGSTTEYSSNESSGNENNEGSGGGINPNWKELLDVLPDEFIRNRALPVLDKWDRNNNQRFEKVQQQYAPYQQLVDNQIPFEDIQTAFMLRNEVQQNPQAIFERLAQHLGYDISKLTGNASESQGLPNPEDNSDLEDLDPRLQGIAQQQEMMRRQQEAMLQMMTLDKQREMQIAQQQQEQQWYQETVSTLDKLGVPKDGDERNRFVQFALMEQQRTGASDVDFNSAWNAYRAWRGPQANATAPDVTPGNGNFAAEKFDFSKMSNEDVENLAIQKLRALNGGK